MLVSALAAVILYISKNKSLIADFKSHIENENIFNCEESAEIKVNSTLKAVNSNPKYQQQKLEDVNVDVDVDVDDTDDVVVDFEYVTFKCHNCNEELSFESGFIKENKKIVCPYCNKPIAPPNI